MHLSRLKPRWGIGLGSLLLLLGGVAHSADSTLAPDVQLPTSQGQVRLQDLRGQVVLVDFWASWCGPCRQSFPWMNDMQARYGEQGLKILAINVDAEREDAERFLRDLPARFTVAFDPQGQSPERFGVMGMPSAYLIDRDGRIHRQHIGFHPDRAQGYEDEIRALLTQNGAPATSARTGETP